MASVLSVKVINELNLMYAHYRKPMEDGELLLWQRNLSGYSDTDIIHAIGAAVRKSIGFCPVIGNVLAELHEARAATSRPGSMYAPMWEKVRHTIEHGSAIAAQRMVQGMEETPRRAMVNMFLEWAQRMAGEDEWERINCGVEERVIQHTDGQLVWYFYALLDFMPYIVSELVAIGAINKES